MKYCNIIGSSIQQHQFSDALSAAPDDLMDKMKGALNMSPDDLYCDIILLDDKDAVIAKYKDIYQADCDYLSFTRMNSRQIIVSVNDVTDKILAHELCHIIMACTGYKLSFVLHELIAQYGESHF